MSFLRDAPTYKKWERVIQAMKNMNGSPDASSLDPPTGQEVYLGGKASMKWDKRTQMMYIPSSHLP